MDDLNNELIDIAATHITDILTIAIQHNSNHAALIVSDTQCPLAAILTAAYRRCLPSATYIDFYSVKPDDIHAAFALLVPSDLVILIQTSSFRLDAFRLRVELFQRALKVIEHPHLGRMTGIEETYYVDALAYDPDYFRGVGHKLKQRIDQAKNAMIDSGEGARLVFSSNLESAKLNVGDYSEMKNVGGQFPIGEVFTEAQDLETVNGSVRIFAFGDTTFSLHMADKPIRLIVEKGRITDVIDSNPEFDLVLEKIRADEGGVVWLRELGFGMNRAFSRTRTVNDIGTYERMCGIHLSLGAKHTIYKKPNFRRTDNTWHHVDVFAVTEAVYLDETSIYHNNNWQL